MYSMDNNILVTILIPNLCEYDYVWILGPKSFRVLGLSDSQMQTSIILLINEYGASIINIHSVATVKIEQSDDDSFVLLDSDGDVYIVVDFFVIPHFSYKIKTSNSVLVFVDVDKFLTINRT